MVVCVEFKDENSRRKHYVDAVQVDAFECIGSNGEQEYVTHVLTRDMAFSLERATVSSDCSGMILVSGYKMKID